jgi:thiol-disulfide isomerase/thioredoxin
MIYKSIMLTACLLMCTLAYAAELPAPPKGIRVYEMGSAPNFTLKDTDGETFMLDNTRGKWVFLHFWASWCGPCRKEMPSIQRMSELIQDDKLAIVMVNTAENEDTIFSFLGETGVELNCLMDKDGLVTEAWQPRGLPTTFLIDPDGVVRFQAIGGREWDKVTYTGFLKQLLNTDS